MLTLSGFHNNYALETSDSFKRVVAKQVLRGVVWSLVLIPTLLVYGVAAMRNVIAVLLLTGSAVGQSATGLVSPNTRDRLNYADATASLTSFEQTNFIAVADRVLCALAPHARIESVIGEVPETGTLALESAENSTVLRADVTFEAMRYAVVLLGRYAHQKFVIAFARAQESGPHRARLITVNAPQSVPRLQLERALFQTGVPFLTLVDDHTAIVFLPGNASDAPIRAAIRRLRATADVQAGYGELIGDNDRARAAAVYDKIIADFEIAHAQPKLSARLWSAEWHDAQGHTCTNGQ